MGILEPLLKPTPTGGETCPTREDLQKALGSEVYLAKRETFHVGELPIHCEIYEHHVDSPVLLYLPGIGTYGELYAEMLWNLSQKGFNVVAIDPPGHGYSGGERGVFSVELVQEAVSEVIDALEQRYEGPYFIFGYSIGALLAVAAAEQDERISKVVCGTLLTTEVPPDLFHFLGWQWTWGSAMLFPWVRLPLSWLVDYDQLLAGHPAGRLINQDPMLVLDYPFKSLSSLFSHKAGIMQQRYPFQIAIVQGDQDEVLSIGYGRRVVFEAEQPIELISVAGEGHMMPLTAPLKLAGIIADWLNT
ncbi:alpha/beta hydrolase [Amphritea japonica]|uniref:Acylglycerol lipase n=1 Tax=Amphritea japonica ATCC BAA-1530 TaxID=1278309 RepID=A0A7R6P1G8_9GAMM|nr:alpha/beta fold hydrolase [Amphritea japonica]BBB25413.1 acylglycerol lipase [Amphritea japonica ATCC BAA-1530]